MSQVFPLPEHRHAHEHTGGTTLGAFLRMTSAGSGGSAVDRVTWDAIVTDAGWEATVPTDAPATPIEGYYDLRGQVSTTYSGDLDVWLEVGGKTVSRSTITTSGSIAFDLASGVVEAGTTLVIRFDPAIVLTEGKLMTQLVDRQLAG